MARTVAFTAGHGAVGGRVAADRVLDIERAVRAVGVGGLDEVDDRLGALEARVADAVVVAVVKVPVRAVQRLYL